MEERQYDKQITAKVNNESKNKINMVTSRSMELTDKNLKGTQAKIMQGIECKPYKVSNASQKQK